MSHSTVLCEKRAGSAHGRYPDSRRRGTHRPHATLRTDISGKAGVQVYFSLKERVGEKLTLPLWQAALGAAIPPRRCAAGRFPLTAGRAFTSIGASIDEGGSGVAVSRNTAVVWADRMGSAAGIVRANSIIDPRRG